ncbi:MAG: phosphatase PAP2 family protein [Bacteroidia bacterium]
MKIGFNFILTITLSIAFLNTNAQNFDTRLLKSINSQNTKYDKLWLGITHSAIPISMATPIVFYGLGHYQYLPQGKQKAYRAVGALAINSLLTFGLKYTINRERPFVSNPDIYKKTHAGSHSFPSGHTSLAFATATNLTLACPKWYVAVPAYLWAGSVGYSRMHLGVHYPSDVLVGAIIGTASSFIAFKVNQKLIR